MVTVHYQCGKLIVLLYGFEDLLKTQVRDVAIGNVKVRQLGPTEIESLGNFLRSHITEIVSFKV